MPGSIGHPAFCHPRLRSGIQGWGGALSGKTRDDTQVVPYGIMVFVCRGGPGCPPFLSFLLRGVGPARRGEEDCGVSAPHDEVLLFRQKNPKPVAPGRGPQEGVPVPRSLWCGLRNSLRSNSPRLHMEWTGPGRSPARRRREAAFFSSVMPGLIGHPGFGGSVIWKDAGRHPSAPLRAGCRSSPTGSWCLCVGAGLGARPSFLFSCEVSAPHDEVPSTSSGQAIFNRGSSVFAFSYP